MWRGPCALALAALAMGCAHLSPPGSQATPPVESLRQELSSLKKRNAHLEAQASAFARKTGTLLSAIRDLQKKNKELEATVERLEREGFMRKSFSPAPPRRREAREPASRARPRARRRTPPPKRRREVRTTTPRKLYNEAYRAVRDGRNEEAIRGFRRFLRLFPASRLAPSAQYWLGEAHYALRQFPAALAAFHRVIQRYPKSRKVPDAHYKRGVAYVRQKHTLNAALEFEKLIKSFPRHPASRKARMQLQNIRHASPAGPGPAGNP